MIRRISSKGNLVTSALLPSMVICLNTFCEESTSSSYTPGNRLGIRRRCTSAPELVLPSLQLGKDFGVCFAASTRRALFQILSGLDYTQPPVEHNFKPFDTSNSVRPEGLFMMNSCGVDVVKSCRILILGYLMELLCPEHLGLWVLPKAGTTSRNVTYPLVTLSLLYTKS